MDQRCPKICYQKKEDGLTVTACYGIDGQIYLPDELGGEPITAIAPYAFSDREPEEGDLCWMEEGADVNTDELVHTARSSSACFPVFQCTLSAA